jgi:hypothetical protein
VKRLTWAVGLFLVGCVAGIALYFFALFVLTALGLSFYSTKAGPFAGLAIWLVGTPVVYLLARRRGQVFAERIVWFLTGMLVFLAAMPWA